MNTDQFKWTREPAACSIGSDTITITTQPHTDLWQRTYYYFRNDNAQRSAPATALDLPVAQDLRDTLEANRDGSAEAAERAVCSRKKAIEEKRNEIDYR